MEYVDVVDEDDKVIGKASRSEVHKQNLIHRSVMFFIFDSNYRILVNKRSINKEFFGGQWSMVLGGHVSSGQTYDEAVVREAEEEADIKSKPFKMGYFRKRLPEEKENVAVYGFIADSMPNLLRQEIESGQFMSLREAETKMRQEPFLPETDDLVTILKEYIKTISK